MHPDIKHLIELQVIDLRLNELRALVASFPKRLAEIDAARPPRGSSSPQSRKP